MTEEIELSSSDDNSKKYSYNINKHYNTEHGFLHLIIGPMFSGKSTRLLNILD